jgi:hypothetical protein
MILIAYIDVALGSMALQAFAGIVIGALVMGRRFLMSPFAWLGLRRSAQECDGGANELEDKTAGPTVR